MTGDNLKNLVGGLLIAGVGALVGLLWRLSLQVDALVIRVNGLEHLVHALVKKP